MHTIIIQNRTTVLQYIMIMKYIILIYINCMHLMF